jgi:hypothetical protein
MTNVELKLQKFVDGYAMVEIGSGDYFFESIP